MWVQLGLYESQMIKNAISGLWYPRRCRLAEGGCFYLTHKADDRSHSGSVLIRQSSRKNSWILKPSVFRCVSSGLKAFCSLNCSKNKYFRRGLNLNVKDSSLCISVHGRSWSEITILLKFACSESKLKLLSPKLLIHTGDSRCWWECNCES